MMSSGAPLRIKLFFWAILGVFSVFFAEVVSGSDMYPFFNIVSYILVIPLYSLHTLFLWYVVLHFGKGKLYVLFPAGAIFGLYEAYITKVLWNPSWGEAIFKIGGVAVIETMVLVLFWHAFMSFILPLFLAETYLTSSREIVNGLPERLRSWYYSSKNSWKIYLFALCFGFFQATGSTSIEYSLGSGLGCSAVLILCVILWRRWVGQKYSMRDLLPGRLGGTIIGVLLVLDYVILGFLLRPEELPDFASQLSIWVLYLFFGVLLYFGLKKSREQEELMVEWEGYPSIRYMVSLAFVFTFGSVIGVSTGLSVYFALFAWVLGISFGLWILNWTVRSVV